MLLNTEAQPSAPILQTFEEATANILQLMSEFIDINTLFIARNDGSHNEMIKVLNVEAPLLEEGDITPFKETFCYLSVERGSDVYVIEDLNAHASTRQLEVTKQLGGGSFIGIPVYYGDGENYGTICGIDTKQFEFTEKHRELFKAMASMLTHVIEIEKAHEQILSLSAPLVPITKGVAVLPIIGDVNEKRADSIIHTALTKSKEYNLDYLIIDLSGILSINNQVGAHLLKIIKILDLIGVEPILTGIRPDLAIKAIGMDVKEDLKQTKIVGTLEQALHNIGFYLAKK
ncbi:rsbT co-antagonist protein RsbR [Sinobaca qinghaiensis]|uniref:RsbT co-antagonist protein RsbR n=1 Tax=Sinobaca qinghaiensis TaxID=342944 RepID=A0A419V4R0_9BACL|nr:GAF domain-containing protein [Sinobaca qinghaiensis]RKD73509.1 rsbT co-antagonist protein RsbR [Sinobaca qinghaiensis]